MEHGRSGPTKFKGRGRTNLNTRSCRVESCLAFPPEKNNALTQKVNAAFGGPRDGGPSNQLGARPRCPRCPPASLNSVINNSEIPDIHHWYTTNPSLLPRLSFADYSFSHNVY